MSEVAIADFNEISQTYRFACAIHVTEIIAVDGRPVMKKICAKFGNIAWSGVLE